MNTFGETLFRHSNVELVTIKQLTEWFQCDGSGRLRLPAIQRSLVWRNEQIVNYWDSVMRGYPPGTMLVTQATNGSEPQSGHGANGKTEEMRAGDFQLFDGQQRLAALLLGLGKGPLRRDRRLWIDIGSAKGSGDRLFDIRINSTGQPFGYQSGKPNEKLPAHDRQKQWLAEGDDPRSPDKIFDAFSGQQVAALATARCAVSLSFILDQLLKTGREATKNSLRALLSCHAAGEKGVYLDELLACLGKATEARLIVNLLEDAVLRKDNYARFFVRLGQGGTRLSDDELSYSLIKQSYPEVRDRIEEIVTGPGRFASDVDLVLGAVRVAQTLAPRPEMEKWAKAARPSPDQIRQLDEKGSATTKPYFLAMLPKEHDRPKKLKIALEQLCRGLQYDCDVNSSGLPTMLLARLPRDLLDVLLLFAFKRGELQTWEGNDKQTLIAFVLYWLMFVKDDAKGAYRIFEVLGRIEWQFSEHSIAALISLFEAASISRRAPRTPDWPDLEDEVQQRPCALAKWEERFTARDREEHPGPGESLRVMSTHSELIRRALIWIQRKYITDRFRNYDPTSTRDDDLPFDLDHAIPRFHFDSRRSDAKLIHLSPEDRVCFDNARNTVGDSLGNMRWLAAPDNRARGKGQIEEPPRVDDHIDRSPWNRLIDLTEWTADDVSTFQRLIDGRTLHLARCLLDEGGLTRLLGIADQPERSAMSGCDA